MPTGNKGKGMRLAYWSSVWFDGVFFPSTGKARRRFVRGARSCIEGYAGYFAFVRSHLCRQTAVALYIAEDALFFQAGKRRWPLSQANLALRYELLPCRFVSRFQVLESDAISWQVTYLHPLRAAFALVDPTYDALDFENDHFLAYVAENATEPEWQHDMRNSWSPKSPAG